MSELPIKDESAFENHLFDCKYCASSVELGMLLRDTIKEKKQEHRFRLLEWLKSKVQEVLPPTLELASALDWRDFTDEAKSLNKALFEVNLTELAFEKEGLAFTKQQNSSALSIERAGGFHPGLRDAAIYALHLPNTTLKQLFGLSVSKKYLIAIEDKLQSLFSTEDLLRIIMIYIDANSIVLKGHITAANTLHFPWTEAQRHELSKEASALVIVYLSPCC